MFVCSRCQGLSVSQFCSRYILPVVNWGDGETAGLRRFDDWCAAAVAEALNITVFVHDIREHASLRRHYHYDVVYT